MKKRYTLEYDMWWEAVIIIDQEAAAETMQETVSFFDSGSRILAQNGNDLALAFLHLLKVPLLKESMLYSLQGLQNYFENEEGFCFKLDGSQGILLESCDNFRFDADDIDITED